MASQHSHRASYGDKGPSDHVHSRGGDSLQAHRTIRWGGPPQALSLCQDDLPSPGSEVLVDVVG